MVFWLPPKMATPASPLPSANPLTLSPIRLFLTIVPVVPAPLSISPYRALPERRLPVAPASTPPITLFGLLSTKMASARLGRASRPVASVPRKLRSMTFPPAP